MSPDGWAALPHGATGLSAVCNCGISWSYSLTILGTIIEIISYQYMISRVYHQLNTARMTDGHKYWI